MKKHLFFLSVAALLSVVPVCLSAEPSMAEQWESGRFVTGTRDGTIAVIGVAGRHHARWDNDISDAEIAAARIDAARKIAMSYGINGSVKSFHRQGAGFFDFIAQSWINLERVVADYTRIAERLTFCIDSDVFVFEGGTLVRFRYAMQATGVNFVGSMNVDGRPGWISGENHPVLDGYLTAVGFSPNRVWLWDTVMRSAEASAARLIKSISTHIDTVTIDVSGQGSFTYIVSSSEGFLNGFRVLEFWIDPENMSVYTLGIARFVE